MKLTSVRSVQYSTSMTMDKGVITLTDLTTNTIKYSININEGKIYSHRTKNPTLMCSGIHTTRIFRNTPNNPFSDFVMDLLGCHHTALYYSKALTYLGFIESIIKIYDEPIVKHIQRTLQQPYMLYTQDLKDRILKEKDFVQWCLHNNVSPFSDDNYINYTSSILVKELCGTDTELYNNISCHALQIFRGVSLNDSATWKPLRIAIRIIQENPLLIYKYTQSDLSVRYRSILQDIHRYLEMCNNMNREPSIKDYVHEELRTRVMYYNWCKAKEVERFQARYSDILKFEQGGLEVILPTHPTDLTKEGNENHNCVGGYINNVISGRCIIVFVRKKDNPTKSYITCEINRDCSIGQFYLRQNNYIREPADIEFRTAYSRYLQDHIDEIKTQLFK